MGGINNQGVCVTLFVTEPDRAPIELGREQRARKVPKPEHRRINTYTGRKEKGPLR